ncbi:MAG TPA: ABC transporter ATP-binding protein [Acidimicrobiales bacterium]|nr:ABC transporter ATP-binding protein [Acidimicrobiales bacterium]
MTAPLPHAEAEPFFQVIDVRLAFGALQVLDGVDLEVHRGEIVGLIGPNGAGKTTLFDAISGYREQATGKVLLNGVDLLERKAWERPWLGLGRTFQQVTLYPNLTVYDCIRVSLHRRMPNQPVRSLLRACLRTATSVDEEERIRAKTDEVVDRLGLADYAGKLAADLSYGTLRMAELACVLALEPELVLLDEPSSGIAQRETEALGPVLRDVRDELGATLVLIEHDMPLIMGISDRIYALANGTILAEGTPEEIQSDPEVIESYLGGSIDLDAEVR